jgi:ribose transport system ATP-binding protein
VDFDLHQGETHVLLGENGAGKSTLVKILTGAISADEGEIQLGGRPVRLRDPRQALRLGISAVYQELSLVPRLSAAENILLGSEPERLPGVIDRKRLLVRAERLLDELGSTLDGATPVSRLSIAQQQMVEIAKALSAESRILILDEPTSALTEAEIGQLFSTMGRLKKRGVSILYISHRLEEIPRIGDRVTVLRDGKRVASRLASEVSLPELIRLMADRKLEEQFPEEAVPPGEELLRVVDLTRGKRLRKVSLTLRAGEILGIAGLVASGRTTLARALFGAEPADSGEIRIRGQAVRIDSPASAIRHGIGFLTEDRKRDGLILTLSVKSNIGLASMDRLVRLGVVSRSKEAGLAGRFIRDLQIKAAGPDQPIAELSGGNQQKVILARWLAREADILILDEPTRGVDVASKAEIYRLMSELRKRGAGILLISSELPEILKMSDRILVLREGAVAAELRREEATQEKILAVALGRAGP